MSPFLPGNKILLNEDNDNNPETIDTSLSEKDDMSYTSPYGLLGGGMTKKLQMMMTNTRSKLRNFKTVMKLLIIMKLQILCVRGDSIINTTKEEEALIQRLITVNFKYHVIQSVIYIVSLCGEK